MIFDIADSSSASQSSWSSAVRSAFPNHRHPPQGCRFSDRPFDYRLGTRPTAGGEKGCTRGRRGAVPHHLLVTTDGKLAALQNEWIEATLARGRAERELQWSEAVAVGRRCFVERVQEQLGTRALYRHVQDVNGVSVLRDPAARYAPHSSGKLTAVSHTGALSSKAS